VGEEENEESRVRRRIFGEEIKCEKKKKRGEVEVCFVGILPGVAAMTWRP